MSDDKIFCERCKQRIFTKPKGITGLFNKGMVYFEFKDGFYCEKCGKRQVEEARGEFKK